MRGYCINRLCGLCLLCVHFLCVVFEVIWWLSNEVSTGYAKSTWLFFLVISRQRCWWKIKPPGGPARSSAVVIEVYQTFTRLICAVTVRKWSKVHHAVSFRKCVISCVCVCVRAGPLVWKDIWSRLLQYTVCQMRLEGSLPPRGVLELPAISQRLNS